MPKVETFLKQEEISDIESKATEKEMIRSALIRAAAVFAMDNAEFDVWLEGHLYLFK